MLFVVTLTYVRPMPEIQAHLETHRHWLAQYVASGHILAAGPLASGTGGIVIAHGEDQSELDAMIREDSFHVHQLVEYGIQAFSPAMRAQAFPSAWASEAKAV